MRTVTETCTRRVGSFNELSDELKKKVRRETADREMATFLWEEYLLDLLDVGDDYRSKIIAVDDQTRGPVRVEFEIRVFDMYARTELGFSNLERALDLPEGELTVPVKQLDDPEEDCMHETLLTTSHRSWGIHSETMLDYGFISDHDFGHYDELVGKVQEALAQAVENTTELFNSDEYTESVIAANEWEFDLDTGKIY